ncbi:MAG: hypothetical protein KC609_19400, partial [Myxococcales bacterium]|nr:hypothetical protein [Myxococcales bacterium]
MWRALLTSTLLVSLLAGVVSGCFDARRSGLVEARGDSASDGGLTDLSTTGSDAPSLADVSGNDGALDGAVEGDTAPGDTALPDSDLGSSDISVDALLPDGGWPTSCGYTIEHRYPMQNEALFRVEVYGVDELGRTTSYERDDDANGSSDYSATFDYYGGSVTIAETTEKTFSATGALRTRVTRHFDPAGQEVSVEVDKDGDGVLDERVERTYADNGTLLSERRIDAQSGLYLTEFLVSLTDFGSVARKEWYENGELKQVERY